ncbi:MAG TPA: polysaccharide deacetylase family protein [Rubrobacteraceae bacterium]|nr:polysaccharide deacetylase family protein [Rubrobacteraceae bacterium]
MIGEELERYPKEGERISAAGHEFGNHSYSHDGMVLVSGDFVGNEVEETDRLIRKDRVRGRDTLSSPYGKKFLALPHFLYETGRTTIMWDVEPESYPEIEADSEKITAHVLDNAEPGSIVLLHPMYDRREETREAIQLIIRGLKQNGNRFVTVSKLLEGAD